MISEMEKGEEGNEAAEYLVDRKLLESSEEFDVLASSELFPQNVMLHQHIRDGTHTGEGGGRKIEGIRKHA